MPFKAVEFHYSDVCIENNMNMKKTNNIVSRFTVERRERERERNNFVGRFVLFVVLIRIYILKYLFNL